MKFKKLIPWLLLGTIVFTLGCGGAAAALAEGNNDNFISINEEPTTICGDTAVNLQLPRDGGNIVKYEDGSLDVTLTVDGGTPFTITPNQSHTENGIVFANFTSPPNFKITVICP